MNKKRKNSPSQPPESFQPKVLLVWLLIFATIIGLWSMYPAQSQPKETLTLQEVISEAKSGNIVRGTIKSDPNRGNKWYVIRGELKVPSEAGIEETKMFVAQGQLTDNKFDELVDSPGGANLSQKPSSTLLTDVLMTLLPILVLLGLVYFFFVRQLRSAGKGAMSFGKSKARMLTRDSQKATFKDVAGCDEAKEEVSEIVEFLRDPQKFKRMGAKVPKGVLMMGPPGTGKTLLARAVAGEADVPFFTISGSDFVEMFVGVGASRVRDMFDQARKNAPCIVFIDEIDAVGRQRGAGLGGGNDEREQTLNSLLVEMDGFDPNEGIIIIAATNRPDVLDNALLRPGRFDRQVTIDLPDILGREQILEVHAKKIKLAKAIELPIVARNTPGFSGADLENLLNESALIAARHNKKEVDMYDIDEAREKISFGRERRKLMDEEDKKITAYHEAGHALIQAVIDDGYLPVHKVTIIPRGQSLGSTMFIPSKDILNHAKKRLLNQICCAMGGRIAEDLVLGEITSGASGDIRMATKLARHMACDWGMTELGPVAYGENKEHIFLGKEISRDQNYSEQTAQLIDKKIHDIITEQYARGESIIKKHMDALEKIAQALLQFETIEGKHVTEIIKEGEIKSPIVTLKTAAEAEQKSIKSDKSGGSDTKSDQNLEANPAASGV